jgi:ribosome biogenesis GTPase
MARRMAQNQHKAIAQHTQDAELISGLVVMNSGRRAWVDIGLAQPICCQQRANLDLVIAGDNVLIRRDLLGDSVIEHCEPRLTQLSRPGFRGQIKPICANIDQVLLVIAPTPHLDLSLLDRSLCYCEWQNLTAIILLNKVELLSPEQREELDQLAQIYRNMGYAWLTTSTYTQAGIECLQNTCQNHSSVLIGNSGVGKSSLTQTLLPDLNIRIQALSQATGLGQHTTSNATLYALPHGGNIIDAAGIRNLDLTRSLLARF